jgi:lipopolysaccharide exporter
MHTEAQKGMLRAGLAADGQFTRHVLTLASGTAAAQLVTVAAAPILSRLYGPEAFGVFGVLLGLTTPLSMIAGCKYELAIMLETSRAAALDALRLVFVACGMWAILLLGIIALGGEQLAGLLGVEGHAALLLLLPGLVFLGGTSNGLSFWTTRQERWRVQSTSEVSRNLTTAAGQLILSAATAGPIGLLVGRFLGELVMLVQLLRGSVAQMAFGGPELARPFWLRLRITGRRLKRVASRHREIALYQTPRALLNSSLNNSPAILLAAILSPEVAGLYWFAARLLRMPVGMVGNAVRRVFFKAAISLRSGGASERPLLLRVTVILFLLGLGPMLVLMAFGPSLFAFVFGEEWREAGAYARWLGLWTWFDLAAAPAGMLVSVHTLQRDFFRVDLMVGGFGILCLLLVAAGGQAELAVGLYAGAMALRSLYGILVVLHRLTPPKAAE